MAEPGGTFRRPKLAKPLVEAGVLTDGDVAQIEGSLLPGETFLDGVVKSKRADDFQVTEILARHYRLPHLRLSTVAIDLRALSFLDQKSALELRCIPVRFEEEHRRLTVAQEDPLDFRARELIGSKRDVVVKVVLASHSAIQDAIRQYYGPGESLDALIRDITDPADLEISSLRKGESEFLDLAATESQPVIKLVNAVISDAVHSRASDIHLEPTVTALKVRYRVDGVLLDTFQVPKWLQNAVISRIKILAELDIAQRRTPQDGRIEVRHHERPIDLRVSTLPTHLGEKVVMRILDTKAYEIGIEDLGFAPEDLAQLRECIRKPQGMLLTTGPTGSGKSTTLYACLSCVRSAKINVITIENPIEYQMAGVNQVQINERAGLTFAATLRSVLRQDPNVIMVGEIRDRETAEIALQAAMTGHLVLSTVHTNDAVSTIFRLRDLQVDATLLGSSLLAVLGQRLVRRTCQACKEAYRPDPAAAEMLGLRGKTGTFLHGRGCEKCRNTGYLGRVGIYEMLVITGRMREAIHRGADEAELRKVARAGGLRPIVEEAAQKVLAGLTTVEEVARVIQTEVTHKSKCPGCRHDVEPEFSSCPFCGYSLKKICAQCGQELRLDWNVCPHCRTAVKTGEAGTPAATPADSPASAQPPATPSAPPPAATPAAPALSETSASSSGRSAGADGSAADESLMIENEALRVLIVDDDPIVRRTVRLFIRRVWGKVELEVAVNGKEALATTERWAPHLVLLDVNMPEMGGFEVCQKLRENIRTAFIPIIIMTVSGEAETRAQAFAVGTDDFIPKPIVPAVLEEKIKRLLHRTYGL